MKKFLLIALLLVLAVVLIAEPTKVALGNLEKKDKDSGYIVNALLKRDLKAVFSENADFELLDIKDTEKEIKKISSNDFVYLGKDEKLNVAKELGVEVIMWGDVTSITKNQFKITFYMLSVDTNEFSDVTFEVTKSTDERRKAMDENIFCTLEEACVVDMGILMDIALQDFSMGDYEKAEQSFLAVLGSDPQNLQAYYYLAAIKYGNKEYDEALKYIEQGLEIDPENKDFLNQLYLTHLMLDQPEEAITALERITEIEENPELWMSIAGLYQSIDYYGEAQGAYENAISITDTLDEAYLELGNLLYEQDYFEEAIPYLEEAMKRYPDDDLLNKRLARTYQKTGKIENAIKQYQDLIKINPDNITALYNLANAYITISDYDKALETALIIQEKNPDNSKVYILLANSYNTLKEYAKAEESARKALEYEPDSYQAYRILSEIYQAKGYVHYEDFLVYEEEAPKLFGEEADNMIEKRDEARNEANSLFQKSLDYLQEAENRTSMNSEMRYIKQRKEILKQLLEATKKSFFE